MADGLRAWYLLEQTHLKAGHSFRMRTAQDAFRKMHREKVRFEKAENEGARREQIDFAINFAATAWHMTDWVWGCHEDSVRRHFCLPLEDWNAHTGLREFQRLMRTSSKGLAACDIIANAAKHGGVAQMKHGRPEFETLLVAYAVEGEPGAVELVAALTERAWSLEVMIDGRVHHPRVLFNEVFMLWFRFLQQQCSPDSA